MKLTASAVLALAALAALAVVGVVVWRNWPDIKKKLDPTSPDNLAYQGASKAVTVAVGYDESVGGWIADQLFKLTHPGFDIRAPVEIRTRPVIYPNAEPPTAMPSLGELGVP